MLGTEGYQDDVDRLLAIEFRIKKLNSRILARNVIFAELITGNKNGGARQLSPSKIVIACRLSVLGSGGALQHSQLSMLSGEWNTAPA